MGDIDAGVVPDGYDPRAVHLPDERTLAYCLYGREDGTPVMFFDGTPGTMFLAPDRLLPVDERGIRLHRRMAHAYVMYPRLTGHRSGQLNFLSTLAPSQRADQTNRPQAATRGLSQYP